MMNIALMHDVRAMEVNHVLVAILAVVMITAAIKYLRN